MRLVFAGTPEFAEIALRALHQAGHEIVLVLTQPDRQAGRGLKTLQSPVKKAALALGLELSQPDSLKKSTDLAGQAKSKLKSLQPDLMVVAAYGLILPADVLCIPRLGCLNIHASLLPRWRGAAPIQRAIQAGDAQTGICIMQMEEGLDTGPIWASETTDIGPSETFGQLHDRLAQIGARLLLDVLGLMARPGGASQKPTPQPQKGISYASKISRDEARIDWQSKVTVVASHIRALDPAPGAHSELLGEPIKIFDPLVVNEPLKNATAGQIIRADAGEIWVACGDGVLAIGALQRPGGKRLSAREFLNGRKVLIGSAFN